MIRTAALLFVIASIQAFILPSKHRFTPFLQGSTVSIGPESGSWQEDVDKILDVDTTCDSRREKATELLSKSSAIFDDVKSAVEERDIKKLAPPNLAYGKAVVGLQAFRRQLFSDVIPDLLFNEGPKMLQDAPRLVNELVTDGPKSMSKAMSKGQELVEKARDISQDPTMLQNTLDDVRREVKNVVKSTPEGLQTPSYKVLKTEDEYEIRQYSSYSVCATELSGDSNDQSNMSPLVTGKGFNKLAGYIFGQNLDMTTPVIIGSGEMEFVLPSGLTSESAPIPEEMDVMLRDIKEECVAVREFTGLATDGEIMRQRASLEDALLADGIAYDNLSFRVLQYNPPYTLPWLRRNEVALTLIEYIPEATIVEESVEDVAVDDETAFFSAPEAGD